MNEKNYLLELEKMEEEKKLVEKQVKLLESEIHKQSLLYEEKIQFL